MAHTEKYTTVIELNSEQAKREIEALRKSIADLRKQQASLPSDSKRYKELEKEINKNNDKLKVMQDRVATVNDTLGKMSAAKPKLLRDTIKEINALLNSGSVERGSERWKALTSTLKDCRTELEKIKSETKASQSGFSRVMKFLNDSWGGIFVVMQSVTGISTTVRQAVADFAEMEEAMASTRKYTGLTADQVRELNEAFKEMDTRTSREQLNELAGAAGRLGKTGKQDILDFVDAGNMIQVALGDDLGEGAIDQIGKLAMAFGEDDRMGLRRAMLATGSAVNELAQNSAAKAGYLVDFTARVGAFGKQLGLTQAQLMGFATVMDEGMLRDEMAATAFGNMLTKMRMDTSKFARIAGMEVKEFTRLLDEDANAAVLRLAENMKRQDSQTMMKMLDDMGLDGSRAVAVISTLADKIDDVRRHQELATKAYEEGRSVVDEYNVMNHTAQAELEKAKKAFHELTVELGEKLKPVVTYTVSAGGMLVKVLKALIDFSLQNGKAIVWLTTVIGTYVALQKIRALWEARITLLTKAQAAADAISNGLMKAKIVLYSALRVAGLLYAATVKTIQGNTVKATQALRLAKAEAMTNPWTAIITVLVALGTATFMAAQKIDDLIDRQKRLRAVTEKVTEGIDEERTRMETLIGIIKSTTSSEGERKQALEELNGKLMEKHLGNVTEEAVRTGEVNKKLREYLDLKTKELKLKAIEDEIGESIKGQREAQKVIDEIMSGNPLKLLKNLDYKSLLFGGPQGNLILDLLDAQMTLRAEISNQNKLLLGRNAVLFDETASNANTGAAGGSIGSLDGDGSTSPYTSPTKPTKTGGKTDKKEEEEKKKRRQELRQRNDQIKAANDELLAMNLAMYTAGEMDYRDYVKRQHKIRLIGIEERMKLYDKEREEMQEKFPELAELATNEYKKLNLKREQLQKQGDEDLLALRLEDIDREHREVVRKLEEGFYDENSKIAEDLHNENSTYYMNERARAEALHRADVVHLQERIKLLRRGSREWLQAKDELDEMEYQHRLKNQQYYQEALDSLRQNYLGQSDERRRTMELNALEDLNMKKLISEEEYQRAKLAIIARYATDPAQQTKDRETGIAQDEFAKAREMAGDANTTNALTGDAVNLQNQMAKLKELYASDKISHAEYLAAKALAVEEFLKNTQEKYGALFDGLGSMYSAASAYAKASSDYETAVITRNYDKQIAAAGNNTKKREKLEKKKDEELRKVKTKANDRAMKIEMAEAVASSALGAINAYTSTAKIPIVGPTLAPIAAAMALAAGALQIATIKKQHQAEAAGYYEGGFTGGRRYRKEAGVVHEGEFVANHEAVNNPAVVPFLNFLDQAQRNNTVGSLTAQDVSRVLGASGGGGGAAVVAPVVNVQTDNSDIAGTMAEAHDVMERLTAQLDAGIAVYMDPEKAQKALDYHKRLKNNR